MVSIGERSESGYAKLCTATHDYNVNMILNKPINIMNDAWICMDVMSSQE